MAISDLRKLAGESLIYGVSGMVTRFVSVFLVPVYTRIFDPSDYGVVSLVVTLAALLNILLILSLDNSMGRWYYDSEDEDERKVTLNCFLWSCIATAVLFALPAAVFSHFLANSILRESRTEPLLVLMAANLPLAVFSTFTTNVLRMQRRAVATTAFTLTTSLLNIGLNILFVVVLRKGIVGIFYAQLISSAVAVVWTIVLFRKQISPRAFRIKQWREMLFFSLPLVPGSVAFWMINLSAAYFIQMMNDTREVGLYYIGANIASVLALLSGAFQMAWGPFAYSIYKRPEARQVYAQALIVFTAVFSFLALGLMLFAPEALMILTTKDYYDASMVAGLLAFNQILIGLGYVAAIGPGIAKNNKAFGLAMVTSAVVLVILNLVLVPRFGKEGAAISILISQSIVPVAVFLHGQRLFPIPYKFGKAFLMFATSLGLGVGTMVALRSFSLSLVENIGVKIVMVLLYSVILFLVLRKEMGHIDIFTDDILES